MGTPKQNRGRKMGKGKGKGSSSSDGNVEPASNEIVADENASTTVDAPYSKDSTVKSGNEESKVEAGEGEKDGKTSDTKRDILTSPIKQDSPGETDSDEVKVSTGSSKKKGKMDKKSPGKVKTPEKNVDSVGE